MKTVLIVLVSAMFLFHNAKAIDPEIGNVNTSNCQLNRLIENDSILKLMQFSNGKILKMTEQYGTFSSVVFYEYYSSGQLKRVIYDYKEGGDNNLKSSVEYSYDASDRVILELYRYAGVTSDSIVYSYISSSLINTIRYTSVMENVKDTILERYHVDANGNVVKKMFTPFRSYAYKNIVPANLKDTFLLAEEKQYYDTLSVADYNIVDFQGVFRTTKMAKMNKVYYYTFSGGQIQQALLYWRNAFYSIINNNIMSITGSSTLSGSEQPYKMECYYDCW